MDSSNTPIELLVQQGQNVLASMKDLKRGAKKKSKERSDLLSKILCERSFICCVYIYGFCNWTISRGPSIPAKT